MTHRLIAGVLPPAEPVAADIIILALDRVEETIAAIQSARNQTGVTTHVYVLDQGSTPDNLARLAASVGAGCSLLAGDTNLGVAGGRNLLSRLGHGRIIVALDNDAEFASYDTVARLAAALEAEPALAAIGCRIVCHGSERDDLSSWGYPRALLPAAGESFDVTFVGAGHAIRRSAWEDVGGYDEALFFCWEEFDFALRAIALGWRFRYRGDIVIRHKVSDEQRVSWSGRRWFYFVRNRLYLERKYGRSGLMRAAGYLVKGTVNRMPVTTARAILAARRMAGLRLEQFQADRKRRPSWPGLTGPSPSVGEHCGNVPQWQEMARSSRAMTGDSDSSQLEIALDAGELRERALAYLRRNDRLHRGGWGRRLMREVCVAIGQSAGAAATTGR